MNELDIERHSRAVDPHLHIWGWEVPAYLFLGGLAAGVMVLSSLLAVRQEGSTRATRRLSLLAPLLVSVGMGALFLDLEHPLHVFRFYLALRPTSPMSWGAWILVGVYPVSLLFSLAILDEADFEWAASQARRVGLETLLRSARKLGQGQLERLRQANLGLGVALGIYTGILLSTLVARPLWNSAVLGFLFLASGLSSGAALLSLLAGSERERHLLSRWDKWAVGVELVLLGLFFIGLFTSGADGRAAADLLLGGRYTAQFWSLVVFAGLLVPVALEVLAERTHRPLPMAAPLLVLLGGLSLRWVMVAAGQA